jgi:cytochrome c oxidase assembly protein subunit 15
VNSASPALARTSFAISPERFRQLAIAAVAMLILIVGTGATVRLTGSGLGCEHWPGCQPGDPFPKKGYHSDIEFSNRVVAFFTVLTTLALAIGAVFTRGLSRRVKTLAWVVFAATLAQAPLGAITVYFHLNPYLVIAHLLLSLAVIGVGVLVLLEATQLIRGTAAALPAIVRAAGSVLVCAVAFLVVTGTLATASGKYPGSSGDTKVRRIGAFQPAVALHVKAVAAFGIVFLLLAGWAWLNRARFPWLLRGCAGLLAILLVQMAIGETQYRTYGTVPWWLVLMHVVAAAALFGWTIGLVARLWRPVARNVT